MEAGRSLFGGNAIFRDIFQAGTRDDVDHVVIAVPLAYKFNRKSKSKKNPGALVPAEELTYEDALGQVCALFDHARVAFSYTVTILGY